MTKNNLFSGYVYMIYNDINNKVYIGETIQKLDKRFKQHMVDSHNLNHRCYNCHFYRAIRKYGIDHFFVRELEMITGTNKNEVKHQIQELEKEYIIKYNSFESGYNSDSGGRGGKVVSDETKKLQSLRKLRDPNLKERMDYARQFTNSAKQVDMYDYNSGEVIETFDSISAISNKYGIDGSSISACCRNKHQYLKVHDIKRVFRYKGEPYVPKYTVEVYTDNGEISEKFVQAADGGKKYKVDNSSIIRCCKGKVASAGKINGLKLKWRYINGTV